MMKIYKTLISFTDEYLGKIMQCDTIEFNGKFWLVPKWLDNLEEGTRTPLRIICLDYLPHQKTEDFGDVDFVINSPMPICVFDGEIPAETEYRFDIVESPDLWIDIPDESTTH
jgi:hypothetical protein